MELRQLRYLVALAEELNFTRAAAAEHIAQPALSQQIRKLEDEIGVALVERTTRHVSLTEAGELLVVRARRILAELDSAQSELEALRGIDRGHVTIGAIHTMGPIDLSLALAEFHARYPHVALSVREQTSEECAELLRIDELDLAFLSVTERVEANELGLHQLISEELLVLLPVDHALARHDEVRMAQLAQEQFISFRQGARLRELLFSAGRDAQFEPRVTLESNESHRIRTLVSRGLGVAILPRSDAIGQGAEVAVARLVAPALRRDITLAWRAGRRHSPAAQAFMELARQTFTDGTAAPGAPASTPASIDF
jgi:LysR family transcriptional regulator, transcription activator of glutamate synthase operon